MPFPADRRAGADPTGAPDQRFRRETAERVLRALAATAVILLLVLMIRALRGGPTVRARGHEVAEALARWSSREVPGAVHVILDSAPGPDVRDWLAALPAAGTEVTWDGAVPAATGVAVEPVVDPTHPIRVWVAAPRGAGVTLRDGLGVIDSTLGHQGGALFVIPQVEGMLHARVNGTEATAILLDSLPVRSVLVLGTASWEGKFVVAALEERGWQVDARFALAPRGDVRQGNPSAQIDTARYAAVVALDSVAARYGPQIRAYVQDGGGLIAAGDAAALSALAPILPGAAGTSLPGGDFADDSTHPRQALALTPVKELKSGALSLERRGGDITIAVWRVGAGRVAQVGYVDTWRWRMAGLDEDPVRAHRLWWSALVSGVAYAPRLDRPVADLAEPTPLASLVSTLGTPGASGPALAGWLDDPRLVPLLFGSMLVALLAEWASRRLRGLA